MNIKDKETVDRLIEEVKKTDLIIGARILVLHEISKSFGCNMEIVKASHAEHCSIDQKMRNARNAMFQPIVAMFSDYRAFLVSELEKLGVKF